VRPHLVVAGRPDRVDDPARARAEPAGVLARSAGSFPSGTSRNGMGAADRVVTIAVAHRWARPTCVINCRIVHSGQVGTERVRSAPSAS
jgi:hypothetical protein